MPQFNKIIASLIKSTWLIDTNYANAQLPFITELLSGIKNINENSDKLNVGTLPFLVDANNFITLNASATDLLLKSDSASPLSNKNNIAVIPINGAIMKDDNCGDAGSMTRAMQVKNLAANPNVAAIIFLIDSPGGMVDGTQTFADAIIDAKQHKPVIGLVQDGQAASGAFWLASQCSEVYVTHETCAVGSIGVFVRLVDSSKAMEAKGYVVHEIYADGSTDKNKVVNDALNNEYASIKEKVLNPIRDTFETAVKNGRGSKLNISKNNPFTGGMYSASEAIQIGLIDGIMSFEQVIARASQLANIQVNSLANNNQMKLNVTDHKALIDLAAITINENETETADITNVELAALNNSVVDLVAKNTNLQNEISAFSKKIEDAETKASELEAEVSRLKVFEPASTIVHQHQSTVDMHNGVDFSEINALPHNAELETNIRFK